MNSAPGFTLFGPDHLATLAIIVTLAVFFGWLGKTTRGSKTVAWTLALFILLVEISKLVVIIGVQGHPWRYSLPLDICRINVFICAATLILRNYRLFEIAYFWSMAGSLGAMLTPDLPVGFPHRLYLMFFIGHGTVVWAIIFTIPGFGFRPQWSSIGRVFAVTSLYAILIAFVNQALDANYLYLREPPAAATILNILGSGVSYYLGLVILVLVACLICYAPFALADLWKPKSES